MIRFSCPSCRTVCKAPDEKAGARTSCPKCGQGVVVPRQAQSVLPSPTAVPRPAAPRQAVLVPVGNCPSCGAAQEAAPEHVGSVLSCTRCGAHFDSRHVSARAPQQSRPAAQPQPNVNVTVNAVADGGNSRSALSVSLGVGSLVIGVLGFLFCWVPLIGLFFSGIGMLLGTACVGFSIYHRGWGGMGLGIAGLAINFVGFAVGLYMMFVWANVANEMDKQKIRTEIRPPAALGAA